MKNKLGVDTRQAFLHIKNILKPRTRDSVTDWACKNIVFSEPGRTVPFSTRGRDFMREIIDCAADPKIREVTLISGTQVGKTAALMAIAGYTIINRPSRIFWVMPTERGYRKFSDSRFKRMVKRSPVIADLITDPRRTLTTSLYYLGGSIVEFVNSNSTDGLSGSPARVVFLDETGKYPISTTREGDAVSRAKMRCKDFSNRFIMITSSPTIEDGPEWQEFLKGDQRRYHLPCIHCQKLVTLAFSETFYTLPRLGNEAFVYWDQDAKTGITWDYQRVKESAHFRCPFCKGKIFDRDKAAMMPNGEWIPTNPITDASTRSYHISSLYASSSSATNVGVMAVKFIKDKRAGLLWSFANGELAEPWIAQSAAKRREKIISSSMQHEGEWFKFLTADYHLNRPHLWWLVRAWNRRGDSYLVDFGSCNSFRQLQAAQKKHGIKDPFVFIDSGFDTQRIYKECITHSEVIANPNAGQLVSSKMERSPDYICYGWTPSKGFAQHRTWRDESTGMPRIFGWGEAEVISDNVSLMVLHYNANAFKDQLELMRIGESQYDWAVTDIAVSNRSVYFKHMDGERRQIDKAGRTVTWTRISNKWPNHLFDCEVLQLVAAASYSILLTVKSEDPENE